ncbi:uncharacterized protein RSE6_07205 [Rhynchosporium secalis]|uniref:Uncharacterized protein n=1 Tax=Rhynchosporium secalis TaxID=38038 RepID=A0A1E1MDB6_RHYSE|nr:uncharacterized protein RSE6_07205 [Rhynchosporium secalis]
MAPQPRRYPKRQIRRPNPPEIPAKAASLSPLHANKNSKLDPNGILKIRPLLNTRSETDAATVFEQLPLRNTRLSLVPKKKRRRRKSTVVGISLEEVQENREEQEDKDEKVTGRYEGIEDADVRPMKERDEELLNEDSDREEGTKRGWKEAGEEELHMSHVDEFVTMFYGFETEQVEEYVFFKLDVLRMNTIGRLGGLLKSDKSKPLALRTTDNEAERLAAILQNWLSTASPFPSIPTPSSPSSSDSDLPSFNTKERYGKGSHDSPISIPSTPTRLPPEILLIHSHGRSLGRQLLATCLDRGIDVISLHRLMKDMADFYAEYSQDLEFQLLDLPDQDQDEYQYQDQSPNESYTRRRYQNQTAKSSTKRKAGVSAKPDRVIKKRKKKRVPPVSILALVLGIDKPGFGYPEWEVLKENAEMIFSLLQGASEEIGDVLKRAEEEGIGGEGVLGDARGRKRGRKSRGK